MKKIKIIDIFSGPGGLGEGFSAYRNNKGNHPFKIALSVEKEASAHATLLLRAFYRQFRDSSVPDEYYQFLRGELGKSPEEQLYPKFPKQAELAKKEARCLTLGEHNNEIKAALTDTLELGEPCILIGGPPCQAYSVVGRSRRTSISDYTIESDHRSFLYKEYLEILKDCAPIVFVMENVKGMLSAKLDGESVFDMIINDLKKPWGNAKKTHTYKIVSLVKDVDSDGELSPKDFVIKMENYGIPQARHRVILLGIRDDYAHKWNKSLLLKASGEVTLKEIIGSLPSLRSGISKEEDNSINWRQAIADIPEKAFDQIGKKSGNLLRNQMKSSINQIKSGSLNRGKNFWHENEINNIYKGMPPDLKEWYEDRSNNKILCNHETRGHMRSDLHRYLFCSVWAKTAIGNGSKIPFPKPEDYPTLLVPKHGNFHSGDFADRFRVQVSNRYATTVTSHISKDGHYFIHYDPDQCRSLTVREAARIQTFPDNYFFLGNRTQQYVQVGNAVPPLLANKIANIIFKIMNI